MAIVETSRPQSGQVITGMRELYVYLVAVHVVHLVHRVHNVHIIFRHAP